MLTMCLLHKEPRGSLILAEMKRVKLEFQVLTAITDTSEKTIWGVSGYENVGMCLRVYVVLLPKCIIFMWMCECVSPFSSISVATNSQYSLALQLYVPFSSAATCNFSLRFLVQCRLHTLYQSFFTGKQWTRIQYKKKALWSWGENICVLLTMSFHIMPLHTYLNHSEI